MNEDPFENFKDLLKLHHEFPTVYHHKFIGKNSPVFIESVAEFEKKFSGLSRVSERQSASGRHLSLSYEYQADSAEAVVELSVESHKIKDLIYIL